MVESTSLVSDAEKVGFDEECVWPDAQDAWTAGASSRRSKTLHERVCDNGQVAG
jgi:hypothetical protein